MKLKVSNYKKSVLAFIFIFVFTAVVPSHMHNGWGSSYRVSAEEVDGQIEPEEPEEPAEAEERNINGEQNENEEQAGTEEPDELGELGEPEDPEELSEPGELEEPEEPGELGESEEPEEPGELGEPEDPEEPGEPGELEEPEEPGEPEQPEESEKPGEPGESEEPEEPGEPEEPEESDDPGEPGEPAESEEPGEPEEEIIPDETEALNKIIDQGHTPEPTFEKELLISYFIELAIISMYPNDQLEAFRIYLENYFDVMPNEEYEAQFDAYYQKEAEALSFIDSIIQSLFAVNIDIRQVLLEALFSSYSFDDTDAQTAVESFILYEMDEELVNEVYGWILDNEEINRYDLVSYLLQVMDYRYSQEEEWGSEGLNLTDEETDAFLSAIGMKTIGDYKQMIFGAPVLRSFFNSPHSVLGDTVFANISEPSLVESFSKTAEPTDEFRTYQISMDFEVGESQYIIPGDSSPVDVVLVIDKSGSMTSNTVFYNNATVTRLAAVKAISKSLVKQIMMANPDSRVSVVSFAADAATDIHLTERGAEIKSDTEVYIPANIQWNRQNSNSPYGIDIPTGSTLYSLSDDGQYVPVTANASRRNNYNYNSNVNAESIKCFVPSYSGLPDTPINIYVKSVTASATGYKGIDDVWRAIDSIVSGGNTSIQSGIIQGYSALGAAGTNKQSMILLSDGEANRRANDIWNGVAVPTNVVSGSNANYIKAGMLEGQWVVEHGVDLYAVGFATSSEALRRTTWSLSPDGAYKDADQTTAASAIGRNSEYPHYGNAPLSERYFSTNEASGLEKIFDQIAEDINVKVGAISNVEITDVMSQAVRDNFDISGLAGGNPASAVSVTGTVNGLPVTPAFTAAYNSDTGALSIKITDALKTGVYKVSLQISAKPDKYAENSEPGLFIETNETAGISYLYQAGASPTDIMRQTYSITSSPSVDIPPLFTADLSISDEIIWESGIAKLTPKVNVVKFEDLKNAGYRIPDAWSDYYNLTKYTYDLREKGAPEALSTSGNEYFLQNLTEGIKEYIFTASMPNGYHTDSASAKIGIVKGALNIIMRNNKNEGLTGLFNVLVGYENGQFSFAADLGVNGISSRLYDVRQDYEAFNATAYVPYGYAVTDIEGNFASFNLAFAMSLAGYKNAASLSDKVDFIKSVMTKTITIKAEKTSNPWFRDWAWVGYMGHYYSEVVAK